MKSFEKLEKEVANHLAISNLYSIVQAHEYHGLKTVVIKAEYEDKIEYWIFQSRYVKGKESKVDCIRLEDSLVKNLGWSVQHAKNLSNTI